MSKRKYVRTVRRIIRRTRDDEAATVALLLLMFGMAAVDRTVGRLARWFR